MDSMHSKTASAVLKGNGFFCVLENALVSPEPSPGTSAPLLICATRGALRCTNDRLAYVHIKKDVFVYRGALNIVTHDTNRLSLVFSAADETADLCAVIDDGSYQLTKSNGKGVLRISIDTLNQKSRLRLFLSVGGESVLYLQLERKERIQESLLPGSWRRARAQILKKVYKRIQEERRRMFSALYTRSFPVRQKQEGSSGRQQNGFLTSLERYEQQIKAAKTGCVGVLRYQLRRLQREVAWLRRLVKKRPNDVDIQSCMIVTDMLGDMLVLLSENSYAQKIWSRTLFERNVEKALSPLPICICEETPPEAATEKTLLHAAVLASVMDEAGDEYALQQTSDNSLLNIEAGAVDWSHRDMLIGSVRSQSQFDYQIKERFYYLPAQYMPQHGSPPAYVAMYLSKRYKNAGIRYWGRIIDVTYLKRSQIPYPITHNNPDELYCRLDVDSWHARHLPITVKEEGVYTPRMTYFFLFSHCVETYELFHICSTEDFMLLQRLRAIVERQPVVDDTPCLVLSKEGREIYRFLPSEFKRSPLRVFLEAKTSFEKAKEES